MADPSSIFRIDATGQTEENAYTGTGLVGDIAQIVEFNNTGLVPDDQSNITSLEVNYKSDLSIHPNPATHLSLIQDGKLGTIEIIINGIFTSPKTAGGIQKIQSWMIEDKTNTSLPFGRFGLRYTNMPQFDLVPTATTAYYLYDFIVKDVEEFQAKATFQIRLYKNGTA